MKSLKLQAEEILSAEKHVQDTKKAKVDREYKKHLQFLEKQFKEGFADYLNLLKKEGIQWKAEMQDRKYSHKGSFIEFTKKDKSVRMDFNSQCSYRYEFVIHDQEPSMARSTFGEWDKKGFILFLYNAFKEDN